MFSSAMSMPCWICIENNSTSSQDHAYMCKNQQNGYTIELIYTTTEVLVYIYITTNKILGNILMHYPTYIDIYAYIESLDNIPSEVQILKIEL